MTTKLKLLCLAVLVTIGVAAVNTNQILPRVIKAEKELQEGKPVLLSPEESVLWRHRNDPDWSEAKAALEQSNAVAFFAAVEAQHEEWRWKDGTTNHYESTNAAALEKKYGIRRGVSTDRRIPIGSFWVSVTFLKHPKERPVVPHFFGLSQVVGVSTGGVEVIQIAAWPESGNPPPSAYYYFNQTWKEHDGIKGFLEGHSRVFPRYYPQ